MTLLYLGWQLSHPPKFPRNPMTHIFEKEKWNDKKGGEREKEGKQTRKKKQIKTKEKRPKKPDLERPKKKKLKKQKKRQKKKNKKRKKKRA